MLFLSSQLTHSTNGYSMKNRILIALLSLGVCIACTGDKKGSKSATKTEVKTSTSKVTAPALAQTTKAPQRQTRA